MLLVLCDEVVAVVVVVMMAGAAAVRSFCARHMLNACSPSMVAPLARLHARHGRSLDRESLPESCLPQNSNPRSKCNPCT